MTLNTGPVSVGPIAPLDSADTYGIVDDRYLIGGYRSVDNYAAMVAITTPRRKRGMLVFVRDVNTEFRLGEDLTTWSPLSDGQWAGLSGGTGDALTLALPYTAVLVDGLTYRFQATATNTGGATLQLTGLGAVPLQDASGNALGANAVSAGTIYQITYRNGAFRLLGGTGGGGAGAEEKLNPANAAERQVTTTERIHWDDVQLERFVMLTNTDYTTAFASAAAHMLNYNKKILVIPDNPILDPGGFRRVRIGRVGNATACVDFQALGLNDVRVVGHGPESSVFELDPVLPRIRTLIFSNYRGTFSPGQMIAGTYGTAFVTSVTTSVNRTASLLAGFTGTFVPGTTTITGPHGTGMVTGATGTTITFAITGGYFDELDNITGSGGQVARIVSFTATALTLVVNGVTGAFARKSSTFAGDSVTNTTGAIGYPMLSTTYNNVRAFRSGTSQDISWEGVGLNGNRPGVGQCLQTGTGAWNLQSARGWRFKDVIAREIAGDAFYIGIATLGSSYLNKPIDNEFDHVFVDGCDRSGFIVGNGFRDLSFKHCEGVNCAQQSFDIEPEGTDELGDSDGLTVEDCTANNRPDGAFFAYNADTAFNISPKTGAIFTRLNIKRLLCNGPFSMHDVQGFTIEDCTIKVDGISANPAFRMYGNCVNGSVSDLVATHTGADPTGVGDGVIALARNSAQQNRDITLTRVTATSASPNRRVLVIDSVDGLCAVLYCRLTGNGQVPVTAITSTYDMSNIQYHHNEHINGNPFGVQITANSSRKMNLSASDNGFFDNQSTKTMTHCWAMSNIRPLTDTPWAITNNRRAVDTQIQEFRIPSISFPILVSGSHAPVPIATSQASNLVSFDCPGDYVGYGDPNLFTPAGLNAAQASTFRRVLTGQIYDKTTATGGAGWVARAGPIPPALTVAASMTLTEAMNTLLCNGSANITLTLPSVATVSDGKRFTFVQQLGASSTTLRGNFVTGSTTVREAINGLQTRVIQMGTVALTVEADKTNLAWVVVSNYATPSSILPLTLNSAQTTFSVPPGCSIHKIVVRNTTVNAVTGGIRVGTAAGGSQVVAATAVGASALVEIRDSALLRTIFSVTGAQTLYFEPVTDINGASLDIFIKLDRLDQRT